jgi:hypothetical protein
VWPTRPNPYIIGQYAIAWPSHCPHGVACPPDARWRVLLITGTSNRGQTSFHPQVVRALRQLVPPEYAVTAIVQRGISSQDWLARTACSTRVGSRCAGGQ